LVLRVADPNDKAFFAGNRFQHILYRFKFEQGTG